jgi:hypothetical protein
MFFTVISVASSATIADFWGPFLRLQLHLGFWYFFLRICEASKLTDVMCKFLESKEPLWQFLASHSHQKFNIDHAVTLLLPALVT